MQAQRLGSVAATRQGPPRHPVQRTHRGRRPDHLRPRLQDGTRRRRVEAQGLALSLRPLAGWVKMKNPAAPAVKREAEEGLAVMRRPKRAEDDGENRYDFE